MTDTAAAAPTPAKSRRWFTWRRAAIAVALLVAFGLGTAAAGGSKTHTVTKTSTVTRTVSAPARALPACRNAISFARSIGATANSEFSEMAPIIPMVAQAAEAGSQQDTATIYAISAKLRKFTAQTDKNAATMRLLVGSFNAAAGDCR